MKVYVAAPWGQREKAASLAERLEKKGHEITHKWWVYEGAAINGMDPDDAFMRRCAEDDFAAVFEADVVVLLNLQERGHETSGKAVETGLALAWSVPIKMIGAKTNVFHYLPQVTVYESEEELEASL